MNMYQGTKKFTRKQLVFVVEAVLSGVSDVVHSSLPPVIPLDEAVARKDEIRAMARGALNAAAQTLPVLYAQLNDDGLGRGDFPQFVELEDMVEEYIDTHTRPGFDPDAFFPDTRPLAESFVDDFFNHYLAK
jgi:stage V sporulation protein SpoVS